MKAHFYLVGLVFALGCPVAPPAEKTTIEVEVSLPTPTATTALTINKAFFSVGGIELVSDIDTEGREVDSAQILSLGTDGDFTLSDAPPGLYSRLKLNFKKPTPETDIPPEFQGERLSLLFEGEVQIADGLLVPFRIQDNKQIRDVNLVLSEGLDLLPGSSTQISVVGDVSKTFVGVAFEQIQPEELTDGVLFFNLEDQPFLNSHPDLEEIADQITANVATIFDN